MAIGLALAPSFATIPQHTKPQEAVAKTPLRECTCGARAFQDKHAEDRKRFATRVAPVGGLAGIYAMRAMEKEAENNVVLTRRHSDPQGEDEKDGPARKRSLWRKLLGKGPKCICEKLAREYEALHPKPKLIQIPSEYVGCVSVRVAGKRVAYTRDMQLRKREAYTPMDAISEDMEEQDDQ